LDGEKEAKARVIMKSFSAHRKALDKIQDKLTASNEIGRQLILSKNKLLDSFEEKKKVYNEQIAGISSGKDILENEKIALEYVTNNYVSKIDSVCNSIQLLNEEITNQFSILDRIENTMKSAIPSENELKKYSLVVDKYKELVVKIKMKKEQLAVKDKDVFLAIDTAVDGMNAITELLIKCKDLVIRNSLMSAVFNSVNILFDLVDGGNVFKDFEKIQYVSENSDNYSKLNLEFAERAAEFRKIANEGIRNISITLGKTFTGKNIIFIIKMLHELLEKMQGMYDLLDENNKNQSQFVQNIMDV
jgi:hypothetical protein